MYESLVGYTPFYADDPVMTCRKILRWQQVRLVVLLTARVVSHRVSLGGLRLVLFVLFR